MQSWKNSAKQFALGRHDAALRLPSKVLSPVAVPGTSKLDHVSGRARAERACQPAIRICPRDGSRSGSAAAVCAAHVAHGINFTKKAGDAPTMAIIGPTNVNDALHALMRCAA